MGTLFIDRKNIHIKLDGNALCFYSEGKKEGTVPVTPLEKIIIVGNVTIDSNVIHRLAKENVSIIFLSGRNMQFGGMLHGRLHFNGLLRLKQYEATKTDFPLRFSK